MQCPHCKQEHSEGAQFCPRTGKKIIIPQNCPYCGSPVNPNWIHCGRCGRKLNEAEGVLNKQEVPITDHSPTQIINPDLSSTINILKPVTREVRSIVDTFEDVPVNTPDGMPLETFTSNEKKRHGCFTAWLVFMCGVYLFTIIFLLSNTDVSTPAPFTTIAGLVGGMVTVFALFKWKKWGFWLLCGLQILAFFYNLSQSVTIWQSLYGLLGIPILYGILQIGKEKKAWTQLE